MSLFSGPIEHAANPPETWRIVRVAARDYAMRTATGEGTLERFERLRDAEAALVLKNTPAHRLYATEAEWYAGKPSDPRFRPYVDVLAENLRLLARWPEGPYAAKVAAVDGSVAAVLAKVAAYDKPLADRVADAVEAARARLAELTAEAEQINAARAMAATS